jgi:predicted amidohydrolase YtcJ
MHASSAFPPTSPKPSDVSAMTIDAAWQCHRDHLCGSLEVGKAADMVVLERDPLAVRADEIRKIPIRSTWLDGERRFAA